MDGELAGGERARVEGHVTACETCAGRKRAFEATSGAVGEMLRVEAPALPSNGLRARVTMGIDAAGRDRGPGLFAGLRWALVPVVVVLPLVAAVVAGLVLRHAGWRGKEGVVLSSLAVPDSRLTPGATRPVEVAELCSDNEGEDDFDPELPASVQSAVFQEYGMNAGRPGEYQVDYLVSPQLGGTNSIENLWPEPYGSTVWNAHAKDALEQRLRRMVCTGQIDLPSAQQAIRVNWIAAYKKYVGGERP